MGDISANFDRSEFACNCGCNTALIDMRLVRSLQRLRDMIGSPIRVTSGYRCPEHNAKVGGAKDSMHMRGFAADVVVPNLGMRELYEAALMVPAFAGGGIGIAPWYMHLDVRLGVARWSYDQQNRVIPFKDPRG